MGAALSEAARRRVLERLGLDRLVTTAYVDILEGHRAHAASLALAGRYQVEGLTIETPPGVYQPHSQSSSLLFLANIAALAPPRLGRALDLGCGSGAVALFVAQRYGAQTLATDISEPALAATRANAERNRVGISVRRSDMFDQIPERDFDLIVFNTPLADLAAEGPYDGGTLVDPGGALLKRFSDRVGDYLAPDGFALFSIFCNTAYERLDGARLNLRVVGLEIVGAGFWRAIVEARRPR